VTSCDDVDLILAVGAVSGGFQDDDLKTVRDHVPGCARCRRSAADYTATADLLGVAVEQVPPPAGLRARILAEVYATSPAGAAVVARQAARTPPAPSLRGRLAGLWRSVPSGRGFTLGGALAAAAAVALLVVSVTRGGGTAPLSAPVSASIAQPAVQGSFTYYPQTQTGVLSVRGLGPQPAHVYEIWLLRSATSVTPAGFLTQQPDGSWTAAIHGSISGYTMVAATVEKPGGVSRPTSDPVLTASLPST